MRTEAQARRDVTTLTNKYKRNPHISDALLTLEKKHWVVGGDEDNPPYSVNMTYLIQGDVIKAVGGDLDDVVEDFERRLQAAITPAAELVGAS
jgi:hypothetical protein